jgi:hypothetical protein
MARVMTGAERDRAKAIGAGAYLRGKRFRTLKEDHIFSALDAAVKTMQALRFPDPFNGRVLGGLAATLIAHDEKSLGDMRQRKIEALTDGTKEDREELLGLIGLSISERYLAARKDEIPAETRLVSAESLLDRLGGVFEEMAELGREMGQVPVMDGEEALTLTKEKPDAGNIAEALIGEVIGSYESLLPLADEDGSLPDVVERRAIAKAAFLRLGVEDLAVLVAERGIEDLPTKAAMAQALAELYEDDLREVANLTLREYGGDPAFGLITRLLPLSSVPDLEAAQLAFEGLRGHYLEVRPRSLLRLRLIRAVPGRTVSHDRGCDPFIQRHPCRSSRRNRTQLQATQGRHQDRSPTGSEVGHDFRETFFRHGPHRCSAAPKRRGRAGPRRSCS